MKTQLDINELATFTVDYLPNITEGHFDNFVADLTAKFNITDDLIDVVYNFVSENILQPPKTPLENLIEEYNTTIGNAAKLNHVVGDIYNILGRTKYHDYYYAPSEYDYKYGMEKINTAIGTHYWAKVLNFESLNDLPLNYSNNDWYDFIGKKVLKLSDLRFDTRNIKNTFNDIKNDLEKFFNATITYLFCYMLKDDARRNHWNKENDKTPVRVEKKVIGTYSGRKTVKIVAFMLSLFDNAFDINKIEDTDKIIYESRDKGITRKIDTKYLTIDTFSNIDHLHFTFKDLSLLKKFNLYVNKLVGRLPTDYGVKPYNKLNATERRLVDEYEGQQSYNELHANYNAYCVKPFENLWTSYINSNEFIKDALK